VAGRESLFKNLAVIITINIMAMSIIRAMVSTAIAGETTFIHMLMRDTNPIPLYITMRFPGPIATIGPMVLDGFGSFLTTIFSNNPGGFEQDYG
jgi:hypothetical protein